MITRVTVAALALSLTLTACSSQEAPPDPVAATERSVSPSTSRTATQGPASLPATAPTSATSASASGVFGLDGLDDLRIGKPVPANSAWAERGAQIGDACRTVTSPKYPGVYAIVADSAVRRITVGQRSDVKLAEEIGVGATEGAVKKWFAGFREEPHKYEPAPAKYLTAPNAEHSESALRFEIGQDGKVKLIHVGTMPELAYVEGCA